MISAGDAGTSEETALKNELTGLETIASQEQVALAGRREVIAAELAALNEEQTRLPGQTSQDLAAAREAEERLRWLEDQVESYDRSALSSTGQAEVRRAITVIIASYGVSAMIWIPLSYSKHLGLGVAVQAVAMCAGWLLGRATARRGLPA